MTGDDARDLREGGRWTPLQTLKNDALYAAARLAILLTSCVPVRHLPRLGRALGWLVWALAPGLRATARRQLAACERALGATPPAPREVFEALGSDLGDTLALLRPSERADRTLDLPDDDAALLARALAEGRGVVFVTAHLGPWERMAALLAERGFPITTIARESYDPRFDRLYDALRTPRGVLAVYRGRSDARVALEGALRAGRVVGFPIDLPGRVTTGPVSLLGQAARLPPGPAALALRSGAPLIVGTPLPGHSRLAVHLERVEVADLAGAATAAERLTQRLADVLSERIAALPAHWVWMHPSFDPPMASARLPRAPPTA